MIKARVIGYDGETEKIGITIPKEYHVFFKGVSFNVTMSGTNLILSSGCIQTITQEQIINYKFEDVRI